MVSNGPDRDAPVRVLSNGFELCSKRDRLEEAEQARLRGSLEVRTQFVRCNLVKAGERAADDKSIFVRVELPLCVVEGDPLLPLGSVSVDPGEDLAFAMGVRMGTFRPPGRRHSDDPATKVPREGRDQCLIR